MIHSIDTMTVGRYALFDRTNKVKYLKRWYNILPVALFKKQLIKFTEDFQILISGNEADYELETEKQRIISSNNLIALVALYYGLHNLLINKVQVNIWKRLFKKVETETGNIKFYTDRVEKLTNIKIKKLLDLKRLEKEIERRTDKHIERFPEKKPDEAKKAISFLALAIAVFSMMGMPYNENMTLAGFSELKTIAEKRAKEQQRQVDKMKRK